jgi:competence protein ComGC
MMMMMMMIIIIIIIIILIRQATVQNTFLNKNGAKNKKFFFHDHVFLHRKQM